HPQLFDLGGVAVGHEAALEPDTGARTRRDRTGQQPARAGFGRRAQPACGAQCRADLARQGACFTIIHDRTPRRTSSAPASKAYSAAMMSSIMTPKPFL